MNAILRAAPAVLLLLLAGCALPATKPDPVPAAEHQNLAEALIRGKDYPGAVRELTLALKQIPGSAPLRLRRGELLETLGNFREARDNYEDGLERLAPDAEAFKEMTYRLALLHLEKLETPKKALPLLSSLAETSAEKADLLAVIALGNGAPREALSLLEPPLRNDPSREMIPRILFHAARAYHLLGDENQTRSTLYQAINHSESLSLSKDIEVFWNRLNRETDTR